MPILVLGAYEEAYMRVLNESLRSVWMDDPVLSNFPPSSTEHAGPIRNVPGENPLDQPLMAVHFQADTSIEEVRNLDVDEHSAFVYELAKAEKAAIAPQLFKSLADVSSAAGTSIDAGGGSAIEGYLQALEVMDLSFDEDGKPGQMQMIISPSGEEALRKYFSDPEQMKSYQKRYDEVIARKREEYFAKKRYRKLS